MTENGRINLNKLWLNEDNMIIHSASDNLKNNIICDSRKCTFD